MAFDGITVAALTKELSDKLTEGRIIKIVQPESDELMLTIKSSSTQYRLLLSADPSLPVAYLTDTNKQAPAAAPGFCMLLRKHLMNGRIIRIYQPGLERIIMFDIQHLNEMGDLCIKTLIVELMGKHSNIIFCEKYEESGTMILDSIKHVSALLSSVREVLPGRKYFIPNTMDKTDPVLSSLSFAEFEENVLSKPLPLSKAIYSSFTGISPVIAHELAYEAGIDGDISTNALSEIDKENIYNRFLFLMNAVKNGVFAPELIMKNNQGNEVKDFSAVHLSMYDDLLTSSYDSISELLMSYYSKKNIISRIRQKSSDLRQIVNNAIERNVKKLDILRAQLRDTEKKDNYKVYGELINAYGYNLPQGAKSFEALNYYTGENIIIPLDPMYTPAENSKRYFNKYQKLKRTKENAAEQLEKTEAELMHLRSVMTSLDIALKEEDLTEIKLELIQTGYIKKQIKNQKGKKEKKEKITSKPLHYVTEDDYHIYVGKNNLQNDELTFKFADKNDWWFHAKKIPGSHVIVKAHGNEELPDKVFEQAAALAALYSQRSMEDLVEVDYLLRRDVKKPGSAKPGFVVYYTNYSMTIAPSDKGLTLLE